MGGAPAGRQCLGSRPTNSIDTTGGGSLLSPADFYQPPGSGAINSGAGTGFTRESIGLNGADYGLQITLKDGGPHDAIAPGWFYPVVVDPDCRGGNCYRDAIAGLRAGHTRAR